MGLEKILGKERGIELPEKINRGKK